MSEKYVVTWDMLQIHARKLASRLLPVEQWKGIIAVSRGGLVPGALLARELGIRHVDTVCISSYDHDNQRELKVLKTCGRRWRRLYRHRRSGGYRRYRRGDPRNVSQSALCHHFRQAGRPPAGGRLRCGYSAGYRIEQPWDMGVVFVPPIAGR